MALFEDKEFGMLARYKIYRGKRDPADPLPSGIRQDIRWRCTKHPLHPPEQLVKDYFAAPGSAAWSSFRMAYTKELHRRYKEDRAPFDKLAALADESDVYIGCNCPTQTNPLVAHCHTFVALEFMKSKYPDLRVAFPSA